MRAAEQILAPSLWASIFACMAACVACAGGSAAKEREPEPVSAAAAPKPAELKCDPAAPVPFEEAKAVVAKRCTSCHSPSGAAGEDYDWTKDAAVIAHRRNVAAQIAGDTMPPPGYPRPTPEERQTLLCWAKGQN